MAEEKTILNKEWVLNRLKENSDLGKEGWRTTSTKIDKDGNEEISTSYKRDLSSSNRASELIGKELGMFTNEINITGLGEVVKELVDKADFVVEKRQGRLEILSRPVQVFFKQ